MTPQHNNFDELGAKVQRAQQAISEIRGTAMVNHIRVTVDANNRLLSVTVKDEDSILRAYEAAVADKQAQYDQAMHEIDHDPQFRSISIFAEANAAREEAEQAAHQRHLAEEKDRYYRQQGWR